MSKRITLNDFEIEQIINALKAHRDATSLNYQVVQVGKGWYDNLIRKLDTKKIGLSEEEVAAPKDYFNV